METPTGTLTDTLMDRVGSLIPAPDDVPIEWGHPGLSTTPPSVAIRDLAARTEALEHAMRAIVLELQALSAHN